MLTGLSYPKNVLTTQVTSMKSNLAIFHSYANQSGFGVDANISLYAVQYVIYAIYATETYGVQHVRLGDSDS